MTTKAEIREYIDRLERRLAAVEAKMERTLEGTRTVPSRTSRPVRLRNASSVGYRAAKRVQRNDGELTFEIVEVPPGRVEELDGNNPSILIAVRAGFLEPVDDDGRVWLASLE